jgi:surface polysaccharide O-acyltransferase-like enzyme
MGNTLDLATVINQTARFAVPCFFVISGYFWARKFKGAGDVYAPTVAMAKRIAFLFVA